MSWLFVDVFKSKVNESLTFVNWALGQPNNFGNDQNFVSISYPNFKWGDWSGDTIGEVICQQEIKGKTKNLSYHCTSPIKGVHTKRLGNEDLEDP